VEEAPAALVVPLENGFGMMLKSLIVCLVCSYQELLCCFWEQSEQGFVIVQEFENLLAIWFVGMCCKAFRP
jgi:hypothetical protein